LESEQETEAESESASDPRRVRSGERVTPRGPGRGHPSSPDAHRARAERLCVGGVRATAAETSIAIERVRVKDRALVTARARRPGAGETPPRSRSGERAFGVGHPSNGERYEEHEP
jgi:hypothetical protein